ncbi:MAG: glutamate racemase [Bacteroidota bacterium]
MTRLHLQHDCIGVFDSGIGGLTVANAVSSLLPAENLIYIADNARAPYGRRTPAEVQQFSRQITDQLLRAGAKLILVACNTATARAIDQLRLDFPTIPFVGIEPAVKPAAAATSSGVIGVLATQITLGSERYQQLASRYTGELRVIEDPCIGLVLKIEAGASEKELRPFLEDILHPMCAAGADTIVLGCTHYPLIADQIQAICGPAVTLINPAQATARQLAHVLESKHATVVTAHSPRYDFWATASAYPLERSLQQLPNLNRRRALVAGQLLLTGPPDSA